MRVILARHCQTDWNVEGRIQGQTNTELNATGHEQAERLARSLLGHGIDAVYCSDLKRAVQTAQKICAVAGLQPIPDERLRECNFGSLEGLMYPEFVLKYGLSDQFGHDALKADFRPFGGESGQQMVERQMQFLDERKALHDTQTIVVVGHGRSLRGVCKKLGHPHKFLRNQGTFIVIQY